MKTLRRKLNKIPETEKKREWIKKSDTYAFGKSNCYLEDLIEYYEDLGLQHANQFANSITKPIEHGQVVAQSIWFDLNANDYYDESDFEWLADCYLNNFVKGNNTRRVFDEVAQGVYDDGIYRDFAQ